MAPNLDWPDVPLPRPNRNALFKIGEQEGCKHQLQDALDYITDRDRYEGIVCRFQLLPLQERCEGSVWCGSMHFPTHTHSRESSVTYTLGSLEISITDDDNCNSPDHGDNYNTNNRSSSSSSSSIDSSNSESNNGAYSNSFGSNVSPPHSPSRTTQPQQTLVESPFVRGMRMTHNLQNLGLITYGQHAHQNRGVDEQHLRDLCGNALLLLNKQVLELRRVNHPGVFGNNAPPFDYNDDGKGE